MKPLTLDEKGLLIRSLLELSLCRKRDHVIAILLFTYRLSINEVCNLRKRVGGGRGAFDGEPFPPRPKGMHWKTYRRLEERYDALQGAWAVGVPQRFGLYG